MADSEVPADGQKDRLEEALEKRLESGESLLAGSGAMTGSSVWGPSSMMAKWCYFGVTSQRVVVLSLARWSTRVKGTWFEDPKDEVSVSNVQYGDPWSSFTYTRPEGTHIKVNFHRFWRHDMAEVLEALGAGTASPD